MKYKQMHDGLSNSNNTYPTNVYRHVGLEDALKLESPAMSEFDTFGVRRDGGREESVADSSDVRLGRFAGDRSTATRLAPPAAFCNVDVSPALSPFALGESWGIMLERRRDRSTRTGPMLDFRLLLLAEAVFEGVEGPRFVEPVCRRRALCEV